MIFGAKTTLSTSATTGISGSISGFQAGDTLGLAAFGFSAAEKLTYVQGTGKGTLTITDGALKATVTLFGQYAAAGFHLAKAGAGTAITYSATTSAHAEITAGHA